MTPRPANRCVSSISSKFSRMSISSCGILFYIFYLTLYLVVQSDGMMGVCVSCVPTIESGVLIFCFALGGA